MAKDENEETDNIEAMCCGATVKRRGISGHMSTHHGFSKGEWDSWSTAKRDDVIAAIKSGKWNGTKTTPPAPPPSENRQQTSPPSNAAPAAAPSPEAAATPSRKSRTASDSPPNEDPRDYLMKKLVDSHPAFNPQTAAAPGPAATGPVASFTPTPQQASTAPPPLNTSREDDERARREREDRERKERDTRELHEKEDRERRDREDKERKERELREAEANKNKSALDIVASKLDALVKLEETKANTDLKKEKEDALKRAEKSEALLALIAERLDPEKQTRKKKKDDDDEEEDPEVVAAKEKKKRRKELGPFADVFETVEDQTKEKLSKALKGSQFTWDAPTISAIRDVVEDGVGGVAKVLVLQMRRGDRREARLERKEERMFRKELALDFFRANGRMPTIREMGMLMGATMIPESTREDSEDRREIDEIEEEIISNEAGAKMVGLAPPKEIAADKIPTVSDKPAAPASPAKATPSSAESSLQAKLKVAQHSPPMGAPPPAPKPPVAPSKRPDDDELEAALKAESDKK